MTGPIDEDRDLPRKGPDAFRTISEVAEELELPQHVLRFWETRFPQIRPVKRGGGRRYYRPADVDLLRGVKRLLYGEGYTIRGVQRILREHGGRKLAEEAGSRPGQGGDAGEARTELRLAGAPQGPEMWASGRRAAEQETSVSADPDEPDGAYGAEREPLAAEDPAVETRPVRRRTLSEDQIGRLSRALDELSACRRLLGERS